MFATSTGIPQGSPLSPILYLIYNSFLVEDANPYQYGSLRQQAGYGWVDDVGLLTWSHTVGSALRRMEWQYHKAEVWARQHASVFDPKKFQLIYFINPKVADQVRRKQKALRLENITLKPKQAVKYLGVWMDRELTFEEHRKQAISRVNGSLEALKGIAGSTWGTSLIGLRKVYQACVIPQMLYGSAIWYNPYDPSIRAPAKKAIVRQFAKIQKRAAIIISGAFRATAAEALDIELYLLPMKMQLEARAEETALRIVTGPATGCPPAWKETRPRRQIQLGGLTPLETYIRKGCLKPAQGEPQEWEAREAFIQAPWRPPPTTVIEGREQAMASHDKIYMTRDIDRNLVIYTDGSGYQGHIGASAYAPQIKSTQRRHLGSDESATVYAAELVGIDMATRLCQQLQDRAGDRFLCATIFTDSQAAIKSIRQPGRASGLQILSRILQAIEDLSTLPVTIRWIPGHEGILGNEEADKAAKNAAEMGRLGVAARFGLQDADQDDRDHFPLPSLAPGMPPGNYAPGICRLAAAMKATIRRGAKIAWERAWASNSITAGPTRRLVRAPSKGPLRVYRGLRKALSSVMVQMRTGRIGLSGFLAKIGIHESARCGCDEGIQTPRHVLLECEFYRDLRGEMLDKVGKLKLPGTGCLDYAALVSEPKAAQYVAEFMIKTGLLNQFWAVQLIEGE
jgi:ribonuclease HI